MRHRLRGGIGSVSRPWILGGLGWFLLSLTSWSAWAQGPGRPAVEPRWIPQEQTITLRDFRFRDGKTLPEIRMHVRTLGQPRRNAAGVVTNAVLILHGTGGTGSTFTSGGPRNLFAGELFGPGQPLDADQYYLIIPDNLGHGQSSKPSDGLKAGFPRYGYEDMVLAQYRLLAEGLKVNHLRLVIGTSMGGMHTWLWGQRYPSFMDALVPLASLPTQISGRNRMWRRTLMDAIERDPAWQQGNYTTQPPGLRTAAQMLSLMSGSALTRQRAAPTLAQADRLFDQEVESRLRQLDANDLLYAVGSSFDYDPAPGLAKIQAPLLAINFADDLINPPELQILETAIRDVPRGEAILKPATPQTVGHGTHTKASIWKADFIRFWERLPPAR